METPLKMERVRRGWTLRQVAEGVGCDPGTLSAIENVAKPNRKIKVVRKHKALRKVSLRTRSPEQTSGASPELAAALAMYFGHAVTELQILYPHRYMTEEIQAKAS